MNVPDAKAMADMLAGRTTVLEALSLSTIGGDLFDAAGKDARRHDAILGRCLRLCHDAGREPVRDNDLTWCVYRFGDGQPCTPPKPTALEAMLAWIEQGGLDDDDG